MLFVAILLRAYYVGGKEANCLHLEPGGEIPHPTYFMILSKVDKAVGKMHVNSWLKRRGRGGVKGQGGRGKKGREGNEGSCCLQLLWWDYRP